MSRPSRFPFAPCAALVLLLVSCRPDTDTAPPSSAGTDLDVVPVWYTGSSPVYSGPSPEWRTVSPSEDGEGSGTSTVTVSGLTGQKVFLVKSNGSGSVAAAGSTGAVLSWELKDSDGVVIRTGSPSAGKAVSAAPVPAFGAGRSSLSFAGGHVTRFDYEPARHPGPPPLPPGGARATGFTSDTPPVRKSPYDASDIDFANLAYHVMDSNTDEWSSVPATLRWVGEYCYIWVADAVHSDVSVFGSDGRITQAQAEELGDRFDEIYPVETALLGHEMGGGLAIGAQGYGGIDGDPRINILVYDIDGDANPDQYHGILGYFWSLDEQKGWYGSNECEMFSLDAYFFDRWPGVMYSTMIHEFQHMIHYARKGDISESWYNEMLSMLAEDVLPASFESHLGIEAEDSPAGCRIPYFNAGYDISGVTDWLSGTDDGTDVLWSYASAYAFGAYLVRNFGGPAMLKAMMDSVDTAGHPTQGIVSVSQALAAVNPGNFNASDGFTRAFATYAQAMFSGGRYASGKDGSGNVLASFYQDSPELSLPLDDGTSCTYRTDAFDPWAAYNCLSGSFNVPDNYRGPLIRSLSGSSLRPWSYTIQSCVDWVEVTGDLTVTLSTAGLAPGMELALVIR